jgi:two-component system, NtrC family, sensor kinase
VNLRLAIPLNLMEKSFQIRITVVLLAVFTAAAAVLASLNFSQESGYQSPTDGVIWVEATGGLLAERVAPASAGQHAGLKAGDLMIKANERPVPRWASLSEEMIRTKVYNTITYTVMRDGVRIEVPVILDAQDRSFNNGFRLIALVYLGIGL